MRSPPTSPPRDALPFVGVVGSVLLRLPLIQIAALGLAQRTQLTPLTPLTR